MSEHEQIPLAVCLEHARQPIPALVPLEQIVPERPIPADLTDEERAYLVKMRDAARAVGNAIVREAKAKENALPTHRISDAIRAATPEQFAQLLEARVVADEDVVFALTELRDDPPELLAQWIERCAKSTVRNALAVVAADRFVARGDAVPQSFDVLFTDHIREEGARLLHGERGAPGAQLALYRRVVERLSSERLQAMLRSIAAFAAPRRDPDQRTPELAEAIAMLPTAATVPWLLELLETCDGEARAYWQQTLLTVFAVAAERGETWSPELDKHLHFGPYLEGGWKTDENLVSMRRILARLALDRAQPIFDRAFAQRQSIALLTFVAIATHPVESVLRPAFTLLTADKIRFVHGNRQTLTHIGDALRALGDEGPYWARWVLEHRRRSHADVSEALHEFLDAAYWADYEKRFPPDGESDEPDPAIDRVAKLADSLREYRGAKDSTTYALLRTDQLDDTYNQIGGIPRGFTPFNWPKRFWKPMHFVCMIDLATVPTLRAGRARALALFVTNGHSRVIELDADQLRQPGKAPRGVEPFTLAGISVTALAVPTRCFAAELDGEEEGHIDERMLRDELWGLPGRAGGSPIRIDEAEGNDFILQFDETFVPELDFGDRGGQVYLFRDAVVWQNH